MIYFLSILMVCTLYVITYIIQNKLHIGNDLLNKMYHFVLTTNLVNSIIICLASLIIFILLSPINFLLTLFIQIKSYGKN